MILILTNERDMAPPRVMAALSAKGADSYRFNTDQFPRHYGISLRYGKDRTQMRLCGPSGELDLASVTAVWNRRPVPVVVDPRLGSDDQEFSRHEAQHTLNALYYELSDRFWVNPYDASRRAEHKPYQLKLAQRLQLEVPRTVFTNDPAAAARFAESCDDGVVYKTQTPHARTVGEMRHGIFTSVADIGRIRDQLHRVRFAPCIFQEYVDKAIELRVNVIGEQVFASALDSQSRDCARVDWRRSVMQGWIPHYASDLPEHIRRKLRQLVADLGLVFGCADMIVTPDGRIVFLEINPNGQWLWVERDTGLPLLDAFTEMLIQARADYRLATA